MLSSLKSLVLSTMNFQLFNFSIFQFLLCVDLGDDFHDALTHLLVLW